VNKVTFAGFGEAIVSHGQHMLRSKEFFPTFSLKTTDMVRLISFELAKVIAVDTTILF